MNPLVRTSLLTLLAGALYALSYPSFISNRGTGILILVALPIFFKQLHQAQNLKQRLLLVLLYNVGLNVTGFYWIPQTLQDFGQLPIVVSWVLGLLFSLILQPHWWLYALWLTYRPGFAWTSERGLLMTAFLLTICERFIPQQFPIFAGSPWLNFQPYLGLASILSVTGFSFFTYWIGLANAEVKVLEPKKFMPIYMAAILLFFAGNFFLRFEKAPSKDFLNVRIVQANVGNFMKISSEKGDVNSLETINNRYKRLSLPENDFKPDLIIWPETAYPDTFFGERTILGQVFKDVIKKTNAEMLIGGYDQDMTKSMMDLYETIFNSSVLISGDKVKASYHKKILIPFGETLPFGPLNSTIVEWVPAVSLFARGKDHPKMETRNGVRFVTPICYEVLESDYMRELLNQYNGNRLIVNHTNDSWYGDTAEPYQHLFLSKWRALEFNMPIVRSTNTGVTSVVFADGSESKQLGVGEEGTLDVKVPLGNGRPTIYQTYGLIPFLLMFFILLGMTWWIEAKKSTSAATTKND
jgi:apolipoprotein N-acyltransferase